MSKPKEITLGRVFKFEAAHNLPDEDIYGKCRHLHGHTYRLEIEITGEINEKGWVCNFDEIKELVENIVLEKYDHKYLNDFFTIPTVENIILKMHADLNEALNSKPYRVSKLKLWETDSNYAEIKS
jgi:6-pyruvoyltetrahydropterin/6-carboxytetrahydropterin synthase